MRVTINGDERELPAATELSGLVAQWIRRDEPHGVAVALNGEIVQRREWSTVELADGDEIEIVQVVIGG